MDPNMQQQPQYYYAPGAPGGPPPGYAHYPTAPVCGPGPGAVLAAGDAPQPLPANGYVLPLQPQPQMMYYPAPHAGYMYYQPPEAAFAALSLSGQTLLPVQQQQQQQLQPQQTPGASSTTSNGSQPRAASTPIPADSDPALLAAGPQQQQQPTSCAPPPPAAAMMPMPVMYTQMPQYYAMPAPAYDAQPHHQMMPMMYQDPTTGQLLQPCMQPMQHQQPTQSQHLQSSSQHILPPHLMNRMDPDALPDSLDDYSHISYQSSPDTFCESPGQRHPPTTPVSSMRRRVSLPPSNQNNMPALLPSNYKTRMCTQWLEKRDCSMGGSCKFAHGNLELRLPERPFRAINNPKYKTKMCKNFEPGANGQCAYAERCEYIHPTDREYAAFKARAESMARARGEYPRYKAMIDEVPGVPGRRAANGAGRVGGSGSTTTTAGGAADEESSKSVDRSSAASSCGGDAPPHPPSQAATRARRPSTGGYLGGSALPPTATRSAIRMGAGADAPPPPSHHQAMRRADWLHGGSMYNLASGTYTDRDEYRTRLHRVPSASNLATSSSSGYGNNGGRTTTMTRFGNVGVGGGTLPKRFAGGARRASLCHLNTAADY